MNRKSTVIQDKMDRELKVNLKEAGDEISDVNKLLKTKFAKRRSIESKVLKKKFED